ncbi:hypothetical protein J0656_03625 [Muricauda ruestringensis]|mgnify:CR=1 FL=1|uniref:Uncharacterized protein n=1 Tax=Flagellimonas aurea TaxID=2915619 RepID=A0ABS3G237_9FLAO|nr:hypothetical protein [Allomuricauda aurea]MBO0353094.1 hypothetical protein [Allomuricauda aurea]
MENYSNRLHHPIKTLRVYTKNEQVFAQYGNRAWAVIPFQWVPVPLFNP